MRKIIIDCDPGHDDVLAVMVALANSDKLDLLGITTVAGNCSVENGTNNILMVLDHLMESVPVSKGYAAPLVRELIAAGDVHGSTGLDGPILEPTKSKTTGMHAIEFMKKCALENDHFTLVTCGPMTNAAMFIKTYPELTCKIDEIISMAGSVYSGNQSPKGEFNVWEDPEAADIVVKSGIKLTIAPIEVCYYGGIYLTESASFANGGKASKLAFDIMEFYNGWAIKNGWDKTAVFDVNTITYLIAPEIYTTKDVVLYIETHGTLTRGMTVCDFRGARHVAPGQENCTVLLEVDRDKFAKLLFDTLAILDKRIEEKCR